MSRNKKVSESLFQFMNLLIALLMKNGQYRTSLHYRATLNSFKRYRDNQDIALSEIDADVMRSYEAYLHHTAKVCSNTSSFYLRILRATYNKAVAKGLTPQHIPSGKSIPVLPKPAREPYPQNLSARSNVWSRSRNCLPKKRWQEIHS